MGEDDNDESDDSSNEEEDDEENNVDDDIKFPFLEKIISSLENFYDAKEDQNLLLKELRAKILFISKINNQYYDEENIICTINIGSMLLINI